MKLNIVGAGLHGISIATKLLEQHRIHLKNLKSLNRLVNQWEYGRKFILISG